MEGSMKRILLLSVAAIGLLSVGAPARADLTLTPGLVGGSGDVDNVIFNACNLGVQLGLSIQGCLNNDHTQLVNFTSNEAIQEDAGGQAIIVAQDGDFDFLKINFANPTVGFDKLQFNLDALADGTATFSAIDQFGTSFNFGSFDISANGENKFTLGSLNGQVAVSFTIQSTAPLQGISDLTQVRLGPTAVDVPEPMSAALLGLGLTALGAARIRRTRS
jgi:hypothetical protein